MNTKQITDIESYFKTENEHFNSFMFLMVCEVLKDSEFENKEQPLELFSNAIDTFMKFHESPLKAIELFNNAINKVSLTPSQKLFVYEYTLKYLKHSEFEQDLTLIKEMLKCHIEKLRAEQPVKPLVKNIRATLKEIVQKEFEQLPEMLESLEPEKRLNVICKLAPFVLPKVESVNFERGEPDEFKIQQWHD
jgi:hypothetical protein